MSQQEILAGLAAIVNEVAGVPVEDVQPDKSFVDDLDVDSLSMVEVVMASRGQVGVKIPDEEVKNLKTVGDAVAYIENQLVSPRADARPSSSSRPAPVRCVKESHSEHARVVVTGVGMTTPVGGDVASSWSAILAGQSGVRPIDAEWIAEQPSRIAGQLAVEPSEVLTKVETRRLDRSQQAAVIAAREAWQDAGAPAVQPERLGAVIGTGIGGVTSLLDAYDTLNERGWSRVSPHMVTMIMPNGPAAVVGLEIGARAGVHSPVSACASGAEAIANAARMIRDGRADVVLTGGTEAVICGITMAGFSAMRALSTRNDDPTAASRPYDTDRDGFVMGEGAGIVVLESREHAKARGASIYGVYGGAGMTSDGHHIAQPDPEGGGAARAMTAALADAGVSTADVHHVNAHATSTPQGTSPRPWPFAALWFACRSSAGHRNKVNDRPPAPAEQAPSNRSSRFWPFGTAPHPHHQPREHGSRDSSASGSQFPHELPSGDIAALNNSFGFGGHDVALVFRSA